MAVVEEGGAGVAEGLDLAGREFDGVVDSIKDPPKNFFAGVPHT